MTPTIGKINLPDKATGMDDVTISGDGVISIMLLTDTVTSGLNVLTIDGNGDM